MMKIQGKVWLGLVYPHKSSSCMKRHYHKKYSGLWKTDTSFRKYLEYMCCSWDLSQACLALISRHSCFDSHLHNSKKKIIKKTRKKHFPSEIVKHHPIGLKNFINLDVRNNLLGKQYTLSPVYWTKGRKCSSLERLVHRVWILDKLLFAAQIWVRIFIYTS